MAKFLEESNDYFGIIEKGFLYDSSNDYFSYYHLKGLTEKLQLSE